METIVTKHLTGNKGEWSELYAFFKILADGTVSIGNSDMSAFPDKSYRITKLGRREKEGRREYKILSHERLLLKSNAEEKIMGAENLKRSILEILQSIKSHDSRSSFRIPAAEVLMEQFGLSSIKSGSANKSDFEMTISEGAMGEEMDMEFSVKSSLGGAASLLNSSSHTNFRFRVTSEDSVVLRNITSMIGLRKNLSRLQALGIKFSFEEMGSEIFEKNLKKAESILPIIVAEILLKYYTGKISGIHELVKEVESDNIFMEKHSLEKGDVEFKVKELLLHVALGMMPGKAWNGRQEASGGYIIVKENGELICYRTYGLDALKEYIYKNVKLDTPSTTRHKFGSFLEKNNSFYIDLNLQIRFKK